MRRTLYRGLVVAACALGSLAPGQPGVRSVCAADAAVEEALRQYNEAQFTGAIATLRAALAGGRLGNRDASEAKALLGRCLVKAGERLEAKEAFKSLLRQHPGYRLDPRAVPPDEVEVFALAQRELSMEQIEAGRRAPASIAFGFGAGSGANENLAEMPRAGGGDDRFESKASFGGSVRFPLRPRLSLDIELQRFRATASDSFPENVGVRYEAWAMPLAVSAYYAAIARTNWRVNVFAGGGPLLAATSTIDLSLGVDRVAIADERIGFYGHGGVEGEFLAHPRFSITGRVLGRVAKASGIYQNTDPDLEIYGTTKLTDRKLDFSGFGAHVGVRAYIGY
jgi:hypothetical protein